MRKGLVRYNTSHRLQQDLEKRREEEKRKKGEGNADIAGQHTEQVRKACRECGEIEPD
jgi:hypothetical protein